MLGILLTVIFQVGQAQRDCHRSSVQPHILRTFGGVCHLFLRRFRHHAAVKIVHGNRCKGREYHRPAEYLLYGVHPRAGIILVHRAHHRHVARRSILPAEPLARCWAWEASQSVWLCPSACLRSSRRCSKELPRFGQLAQHTVKVVLGFVELILSLKFLSVADLAYGWRILDREVFIAIWIVLFVLLEYTCSANYVSATTAR